MFRWLVWFVFVAAWTVALLTPRPARLATDLLPEATLYPSFKLAHLVCYAVVTALSGWLRVAWRHRGLLVAFVSGHAFATEFLQQFVPGRTPSWGDIGINHIGIVLGLALSWKCWRDRS